MANHEKTEKPTPKRRGDARKKGQVAKSADLNTAVVLTVGLIAVAAWGPGIVNSVGDYMQSTFLLIQRPGVALSGAGLNGQLQTPRQPDAVDRRSDRRRPAWWRACSSTC